MNSLVRDLKITVSRRPTLCLLGRAMAWCGAWHEAAVDLDSLQLGVPNGRR